MRAIFPPIGAVYELNSTIQILSMRRLVGIIFFSFSSSVVGHAALFFSAQLAAFLLFDRCACVIAVWSPT